MRPTNREPSERHPRSVFAGRGVLGAIGGLALVVAVAGGANAHIGVTSSDAKSEGKNATLMFKIANEEADASTTKVEINLPTDTPLVGVSAEAPAGWNAEATDTKVVFSGGSLEGHDPVTFPIKVAQLPKADKLVFKALQTYSNGEVVRWIEQSAAGAGEAAKPAPVLDLANPTAGHVDAVPHGSESSSTEAGGHDDGAAPTRVHAGTGGQAAESGAAGMPLTGGALVLLGLGAAAVGARRLLRQ